ncbi:ski oncogene-like [Mya arenaria]|uniref:ski oncogene-like n=1 Tax=Mya arenaria TaxID=6604 RepID=UPI0022DEFF41|nr:ski oncogene-like [Mya arenaria]
MENAPQSVSPHIQRVLKSFQTSANRTLQGPGVVNLPNAHDRVQAQQMAKLSSEEYTRKAFEVQSNMSKEFEYMYQLKCRVQQIPVFTPADSGSSEKSETLLENEKIACFLVGGEKRLCLPQILNTVLKHSELSEINTACDDLHIFCSRCQPEQLEILKRSGDLPMTAPSCGLITKTDAERLCNALLRSTEEPPLSHPSPNSFKVYHECFGKCKGNFNTDAYTSPHANCIQCTDCGRWLTPQQFVRHSHKSLENRTCHWGFDSANWRHYVLLAKHQPGIDKLQEVLESIKARFDGSNKYKRKQGSDVLLQDGAKRSKSDGSSSSSPDASWETGSSSLRAMMSAFQPWSAKDGKMLPTPPAIMREGIADIAPSYLRSGPPVLLHPDKVVPHSESSRYEPNYAPNVSLAPVQKCKGEDDEEDTLEPESEKKPGSPAHVDPVEPGPSKPYREWDLSESDDSSVGQSSPSHGEDSRLSPTTENQRALEIELEMIRQALDGKIGNEKEEKDRFLHEFCKLRAKHQELLNRNIQARRNLKQELASAKANTKERLLEVHERNHAVELELTKVRRESECRLKEVQDENSKLLNDVKLLQDRDDIGMGKVIQLNQELSSRLQQYEVLLEQVRIDNMMMREKLLQMGVNVMDLTKASYPGGNCKLLCSPSGSPPQRSPSETPGAALLAGYAAHMLHSSMLQQYAGLSGVSAERYIKKERDGT